MIINERRFADLDVFTFHALVKLRCDVFVVEQECAYPEFDGRDVEPDTRHLWISDDTNQPLAYLRILADPGGVARIGRVVTAPHARGRGLSQQLLKSALDRIGNRTCVLDAQSHLVGFYERLGFTPSAPEYIEDGIPHTPMQR
ncbi:ElaA protein [Virgisporangium aliadipatigenens]|uniref:ElaA protein n=1 Tax=Virgisporangium aliadipatigenens TaxID=741659 RepID=A0A8J4DVW4_9ACTN|nr:GNAT family N-acetyltransferase [Virgisporangium aliadipatigenens]GIJ51881.1 ElaA protein [Virgisporangium aliadipatigenens]